MLFNHFKSISHPLGLSLLVCVLGFALGKAPQAIAQGESSAVIPQNELQVRDAIDEAQQQLGPEAPSPDGEKQEEIFTTSINMMHNLHNSTTYIDMMWFVDSSWGTPVQHVHHVAKRIAEKLGNTRKFNVNLKLGFYGHKKSFPSQWRESMRKVMQDNYGSADLFQVFDVNPRDKNKSLNVKSTLALYHSIGWLSTFPKAFPNYPNVTGASFFRDSATLDPKKILVYVTTDDSKKYAKKRGWFSSLIWIVFTVVTAVVTAGVSSLAGGFMWQILAGGLVAGGAAAMVQADYEAKLRENYKKTYHSLSQLKRHQDHPKENDLFDALNERFPPQHEYDSHLANVEVWAFVGGGERKVYKRKVYKKSSEGNDDSMLLANDLRKCQLSSPTLSKGVKIVSDDSGLSKQQKRDMQKIEYVIEEWDITGADKFHSDEVVDDCGVYNVLKNHSSSLQNKRGGSLGLACLYKEKNIKWKISNSPQPKSGCSVMCNVDFDVFEERLKSSDQWKKMDHDDRNETLEKLKKTKEAIEKTKPETKEALPESGPCYFEKDLYGEVIKKHVPKGYSPRSAVRGFRMRGERPSYAVAERKPVGSMDILVHQGRLYLKNYFFFPKSFCPLDFSDLEYYKRDRDRLDDISYRDCSLAKRTKSKRRGRDHRENVYDNWINKVDLVKKIRDRERFPTCLQVCSNTHLKLSEGCSVKRKGKEYIKAAERTGGLSAPLCGEWQGTVDKRLDEKYSFNKEIFSPGNFTFSLDHNDVSTVKKILSFSINYEGNKNSFIANDEKNSCLIDAINSEELSLIRGRTAVGSSSTTVSLPTKLIGNKEARELVNCSKSTVEGFKKALGMKAESDPQPSEVTFTFN